MASADVQYLCFSQGTLPPPYSSPLPSEANGSLSSPVSTMTSQSSASSLAKHRQSWLDLVSQASPVAGETLVCSVEVHRHGPPHEEEEEEPLENAASEDSAIPEGQTQVPALNSEEGKTAGHLGIHRCCVEFVGEVVEGSYH